MKTITGFLPLLFFSIIALGQPAGHIDKKTKEFFISPNPKAEYRIFGYEYPNVSTKKMICFSTYSGDVRDNYYKCPLGSYFDTSLMREGDKIVYIGPAGSFGKMSYISGDGKKIIFYLSKSGYVIR